MNDSALMLPLHTAVAPSVTQVGGKAASLMRLLRAGFAVPGGRVLTAEFFAPWADAIMASSEWRRVRQLACAGADHRAELTAACGRAKQLVRHLLLDAQRSAIVTSISAEIGRDLVAVRSSSPEEDLGDASFAGLYATVLNVAASRVEAAIRECFASCLDARVIIYKVQKGMAVDRPRIALVIQHQVEAEVSGVAFSINPLTNDFDECLINASWGLGEALVSGAVTPDRWVVDKVDCRTLESQPGSKGGDRAQQLCLNGMQVTLLTETLCAIEALDGGPVDVEWAFASGELHVLQARPVTTYVPLPLSMQTRPGEPRVLYHDPFLADGITISSAVSLVTNDLILLMLEDLHRVMLGPRATMDRNVRRGVFGIGGPRLYLNLSHLMHVFDLTALTEDRRFLDTTMADIYQTLDVKRYRAVTPPSYLSKARVLLALPGVLWRTRALLRALLNAMLRSGAFHERYRQTLEDFEHTIRSLPDTALPIGEFCRALYREVGRVAVIATGPALIMYVLRGTRALDMLIDRDDAEQVRLAAAIKSGTQNVVLQMGLALHGLAQQLPRAAFADLDALANAVATRSLPAPFLAQWDAFVQRYGNRGPLEMDLANPKYADDPKIALRQMAMLAGSSAADASAGHERKVAEREAAFRKLHAMLSVRERPRLARAYANITAFEKSREMPKQHITLANAHIRAQLLAIAERWCAAGRIDRRDDIFQLTLDDIEQGERDATTDLRARLAAHNRFNAKSRALVRHYPHVIDSRGRIVRPVRRSEPGVLTGHAVSAGVATGPVKVLDDPSHKVIEPGDILVAYTTDPGWTPLFINAAAVLLEVGGELQHGALVAREYGKPCIAGIVNVTQDLRDGQIVEVDANAGVVRILTPTPPVEAPSIDRHANVPPVDVAWLPQSTSGPNGLPSATL